jgi:hypothetical protein
MLKADVAVMVVLVLHVRVVVPRVVVRYVTLDGHQAVMADRVVTFGLKRVARLVIWAV